MFGLNLAPVFFFFFHGCYKPAGCEERFIKLAAQGRKCDGNFV